MKAPLRNFFDTPLETQLVRRVTTREIKHMGDGRFHVAVMDYGAKANILRELVNSDCRLTIFPAETKAEEVLAVNPDGIFLSNGPGDPKDVPYIVEEVKKMIGKKPIFGICLGLQMLGLALGGKSRKLTSVTAVPTIRSKISARAASTLRPRTTATSSMKLRCRLTSSSRTATSTTTPLKVLKSRPRTSCASSTIGSFAGTD